MEEILRYQTVGFEALKAFAAKQCKFSFDLGKALQQR